MQAINSRAEATLSSSATRSLTGLPALVKSSIKRVVDGCVEGMVDGYDGGIDRRPGAARLGTPGQSGLLDDVRAHAISPSGKVAAVEIEDEPPALDGGLHPVHGPIDGEEPVPGVLE